MSETRVDYHNVALWQEAEIFTRMGELVLNLEDMEEVDRIVSEIEINHLDFELEYRDGM